MRGAVEQDLVDPEREHLVAQRLHRIREILPAAGLRLAGEGFGGDHVLAVDVRGGGDHLDGAVVGPRRARPEFARRYLRAARNLQRIERTGAVALDKKAQPGLVRALLHPAVVIVGHHVRQRAAEIEQEAIRCVAIADDAARQRGKIGQDVIIVACREIGRQRRRPVLQASLETVDHGHVERLADKRSRRFHQLADAVVELIIDRRRAQLVDLEPAPRIGCGHVDMTGAGVAEAHHRPAPRRRRPAQRSIGGELIGDVDHLVGIDRIARVAIGGAPRGVRRHLECVFGLRAPILDSGAGVERRLGEHRFARRRDSEMAGGDRREVERAGRFDPAFAADRHLAHRAPLDAIVRCVDRRGKGGIVRAVERDGTRGEGCFHRDDQRRTRRNLGDGVQIAVGQRGGRNPGTHTHRGDPLPVIALVALRCRKGDHESVAIIIALGIGAGELYRQRLAADDRGLGPHDLLHRQRGRDPRPAARRPARCVVQPDLEAEFIGLGRHVRHQLEPLRAHVIDRPLGHVAAAVEHHRAAEADVAHPGEVGVETLPGDVAVHPVIEGARPLGGPARRPPSSPAPPARFPSSIVRSLSSSTPASFKG